MMQQNGSGKAPVTDRLREERLDILAGTRGKDDQRAVRHNELEEAVTKIVLSILAKRGL